MSIAIFSVSIGQARQATELLSYLDRLSRIRNGLEDLLRPICRSSQIQMFTRVDSDGQEWLDVHVKEGDQLSMVPEFERSLGSSLKVHDIEGKLAEKRVRLAIELLTELTTRRQWSFSDFWDVVDPGSVTRAGRRMGDDQGRLVVRTPDGRSASTSLPNRRFSAVRTSPVQLQFLPLSVGRVRALVKLSKSDRLMVNSRSRRIDIFWHSDDSASIAEDLFRAVKEQGWVWARCRVIDNCDGQAKALLVDSMQRPPSIS